MLIFRWLYLKSSLVQRYNKNSLSDLYNQEYAEKFPHKALISFKLSFVYKTNFLHSMSLEERTN